MDKFEYISFVTSSEIDHIIEYMGEHFDIISSHRRLIPLNRWEYNFYIKRLSSPNLSIRNGWSDQIHHSESLAQLNDMIEPIKLFDLRFRHAPDPVYQAFIIDYLSIMLSHEVEIEVDGEYLVPVISYYPHGPKMEHSNIYNSPIQNQRIKDRIDISFSPDKVSIGMDPLIPYLLKENYPGYSAVVEKRDGQYFIPLSMITDDNPVKILRGILSDQIRSLIEDGYLSIESNSIIENIKVLIRDWNYELIDDMNDTIVIRQKNLNLTPDSPGEFINKSLDNIRSGGIPENRIGGPWQILLNKTMENRARIYYETVMVLKDDEYLRMFIPKIKVYNDLSINIPCLDNSDYMSIRQMIASKSGDMDKLFCQSVTDIDESIVLRSLLFDVHPTLRYLLVSIDNRFFVVGPSTEMNVNSRDVIIHRRVRDRFIDHLKVKCQTNSDTVTLVSFDEMTLNELALIIQPEEKINYCISIETLKQTDSPFSPITRKPFHPREFRLIDEPYLLVSGYIKCGYIPGLFDQIPTKYDLLPIDLHTITNASIEYDQRLSVSIRGGEPQIIVNFSNKLTSSEQESILNRWYNGEFISVYDIYIFKAYGEYPTTYSFNFDFYRGNKHREYLLAQN